MLKLSIIIPVYNVEKYIRKCLESCLCQDLPYEEYEIIVVNDGTPDRSIYYVEEIKKNQFAKYGFCNIHVIERENGGLSAARNTGIKEALGEYVWFIDGDDWIEPNVLKGLIDRAMRDDLDVLCFNFQFVFPNGLIKKNGSINHAEECTYNGEAFFCQVKMPAMAWLSFYKREYLLRNKLFFYEGIIHEDQEFTPRAYCLAGKITYCDFVVYNYLQREGGIMKSNQAERRCRNLLMVADSLFSFASTHLVKGTSAYDGMMAKVSFAFTQSLAYYNSSIMSIDRYNQREYYPLYISTCLNIKERLKYRLVNLSIRFYLCIYALFYKK